MSANPRRIRSLGALGLLAIAALSSREAQGYSRTGGIWTTLPVRYRWNPATVPASLGEANGRAAIDGGFAIWASQPCTSFRAENVGTSTLTRTSSGDRENTIFWISGAWPPELGPVNSVIGVTLPVSSGGRNIDADIAFNAVGFRWSTTGAPGTVDAASIAVHEEGHFLGLGHTTSPRNSIMYPAYSGGMNVVPSSDDRLGVCTLYPGTGTPTPDGGTPPPPPPPPPPAGDPCLAITSCDECTPQATCGWCASSRQCLTGNATNPASGSCADWRPFPMNCAAPPPPPPPPVDGGTRADSGAPFDSGVLTVDPCDRYAACGSCASASNCGWCGATNRCMYSTSRTGPSSGSCGGGWSADPTMCGGDIGGTTMFGGGCRSSLDCSSGGPCISLPGGSPFCSQRCEDDCSCPRGYACVSTSAGFSVCVVGTNRCAATDAGTTFPDVPRGDDARVPADTGAPPPRDGGFANDTSPPPADNGIEEPLAEPGGCGCRTTDTRTNTPGAMIALALVTLARRRRRR